MSIIRGSLVGLSPSFAFYAQETRANSMTLMLASFVTVAALRLRKTHQTARKMDERSNDMDFVRALNYPASIVLSLAHNLGWIYVFSLATINFFERSVERKRWRTIVLVVLISVWPIWHLFAGGLNSKTGANSIYGAPPVRGTINAYLNGCLPPLALGSSPYTVLMAWVFLLALALVGFISFPRIRCFSLNPDNLNCDLAGESRILLLSITVMLAITIVIGLHTPMLMKL